VWQGLIGSILLYGAFLVHGGLGFAAFYQRRFYGLTLLDVAQLVLGLAISALLANHLADTRLALLLYGLPKRYSRVLITFWVLVPLFGVLQVAVLTVAWSHGCIGIHNAFRLKRWYGRASRSLLVIAILIPVLALSVSCKARGRPRAIWRSRPGVLLSSLRKGLVRQPRLPHYSIYVTSSFLPIHIGWLNAVGDRKGEDINQDMPFSSFHPLMPIKATRAALSSCCAPPEAQFR